MALGLAEERQARERQLRRRRGAGQERGIVLEKARRGRSVEEVDGVVEREEELRLPFSTLDLADGEGEVHRELPLAGGEASQSLGTRPGEEHLERQAARRIVGPRLVGPGSPARASNGRSAFASAARGRRPPTPPAARRRIAGPLDAQRQEARARPFLSVLGSVSQPPR